MRVFLKALLTMVFLCLLGYGVFTGLNSDQFRIVEVSFHLPDQRDPSYLFPKIEADLRPQLSGLLGQYIWKVNLEKIMASLERDRRLKDLKITRHWPSRIRVDIKPHQAIANILSDDSDVIYPISMEGGLFPPTRLEDVSDAPILRGSVFLKNEGLRKLSLDLLSALPSEGPLSLKSVSEISFKKKEGLVLVLGPEGTEVILGREDFARRINYVGRVVQYLRSENLRGRVIDARFQKKVVVRLRNAS